MAAGPGYIGMIGSARKRGLIFDQLLSDGVSAQELAQVSCPIGLPIGAETPEEIAVSIAAELIATRAGLSRRA
jgi:xanthine dehydrogenase accessory factor